MLRTVRGFILPCAHCDADTGTSGGACTVASPFEDKVAKNCKTIPHVDKAICAKGACKVQSCKDGFDVSPSQDSCVGHRLNRIRDATSDCIDKILAFLDSVHLLGAVDVASLKQWLLDNFQECDLDAILNALVSKGVIIDKTFDELKESFKLFGPGANAH